MSEIITNDKKNDQSGNDSLVGTDISNITEPNTATSDRVRRNEPNTTISKIDKIAPYIFVGSLVIAIFAGIYIYSRTKSSSNDTSKKLTQITPDNYNTQIAVDTNQKLPLAITISNQNEPENNKIVPTTSLINTNITPSIVPPTPTNKPTPTPTINTGPGMYACDPNGICNVYGDPSGSGQCPKTFADIQCLQQCHALAVRCAN